MFRRKRDRASSLKGGGEATLAAARQDSLSGVLTAAGLLLVAAAIVVAAYPLAYSAWRGYRADRQFTAERETISQYDDSRIGELIEAAERYNARIAGQGPEGGDIPLYEDQLALDDADDDVVCWLEIPSLDIRLPVFRDDGTDSVPPEGAEHVRGSSLPVGGVPSNTVITAHSGSHQGASMAFNRLESLVEGDVIVLWTLGRPYAYRVSGMRQTSPDDASGLRLADGADVLTLVTCRPIGTTAERLFVRAERCAYVQGADNGVRVEVLLGPDLLRFLCMLAAAMLLLWLVLVVASRRRASRHSQKAMRGAGCAVLVALALLAATPDAALAQSGELVPATVELARTREVDEPVWDATMPEAGLPADSTSFAAMLPMAGALAAFWARRLVR